ncbi:ATP-binding cassette domain-containing protein, partial [Escherichia coli]
RGGPLKHLSFSAHRGEILGLSGLAGSGVDEVLWFVGGIDPRDGGSVTVDGMPLRSGDRLQAARAGVAYVPGTVASRPSRVMTSVPTSPYRACA